MSVRPPRVLAVASGGGHWIQLIRLIPAWDGCGVTYVTTNAGFENDVDAIAVERNQPKPAYYVIVDANRWQKLRLLKSLLQIVSILLKVRPDVIITTGAAPGYFALRVGKMLGCRTVWIDSIANAEELSLAGRKARPHSDLWLTQWQHLSTPEGPEYRGSVL